MSDSVGKISLDLEVKSDLSKQIGDVSAELGKKLENTFTNSTKGIFDGVNESIEANMKAISNVIKVALEQMQANVKASIDALMELTKGIKTQIPKINLENSTVPNTPNVITPSIPRAPPVMPQGVVIPEAPSIPNLNLEQVKDQIENLTSSLDIVNSKIEQQQAKLLGLKEAYNNTFNQGRKNKIQEQILRTEGVINKLIGTSDKLGFKLADLDEKFAVLSASARESTAGVNAVNSSLKSVNNVSSKVSGGFKLLGNSARNTGNNMRHMNFSLGMIMRQFFTWMVVLPLLMRGLTAMTTFLGQAFMTNSQFANSLAQIRSNLYTAFMPIFQAVLPAVNALMSSLATITAYIASFTSTLFGKTYNQSFGAAKGLIAAKTAMGAYGEAAKKASKDAKGALAGFDEINTLNMGKDADGGAGAGSDKVPQMVAPGMNTSALDNSTKVWADKFKAVLNTIFQPFKNAWAKDGAGVISKFKNAVEGTKGTLKNFFDMLATPPVQLFIENVARIGLALVKLALRIYDGFILPIVNWFINLLPGAANGLNPVLEVVRNLVDYLSGDGFTYVQTFLSGLLGVFVAFKAFNFLQTVITTVKTLITGLSAMWGILIANPVVAVIAVIIGLIAAFAALYASNEAFRNKVNEVFKSISDYLKPIFEQLKNVLVDLWNNVMIPLGKFLVDVFAIAFNVVANVAKDLWNLVLKPLADFLITTFVKVVQAVIDIWKAWEGVKEVFSGVFGGLSTILKAPLNAVIGLINTVLRGVDSVSGVLNNIPGVSIAKTPKIPYLARGGVVDSPTLAMVGEAGKEAVMPLENNTGWINNLAGQISAQLGNNNNGTTNSEIVDLLKQILKALSDQSGDLVIKIGESEFARIAIDAINKRTRQNGFCELKI